MHEAINTPLPRRRNAHRYNRKSQWRFYMRENVPVFSEKLCEVFLFFFLSLSECFHLPSPFAICALSAYLFAGKKLLFPAIGLGVSFGLRLLWGIDLDAWQYIGCTLLLLMRFKPPKAIWAACVYAASALSLRSLSLILSPSTQQEAILCCASLLTGVLCTPAICQAVRLSQHPRSRMRMDDLLCCLVLCSVMLTGAGRVMIWQVNLGFLLSGTVILLCASIGGCTSAVCAGLLCGISLSLCGHADGYVVCYAFCGIVCGLFYGRKRWVLCLIYLLCCLFTSYAVHFAFDTRFFCAAVCSCGLFMLLPRRSLSAAFSTVRSLSPDRCDNETAYAQCMRKQWIANISQIAHLLPEVRLPVPNEEEELSDIAERLCVGCDQFPICWRDKADESRQALRAYFFQGDHAACMAACPRLERWPAFALEHERAEQQRALRYTYAQREREATRTHLNAIAQAMSRFSQEGSMCDHDDDLLLGEASYLLRQMHLPAHIQYALRIAQHVTLSMRYEPQLIRQRQLERYCEALSQSLNVPLYISQRSKDTLLLEEAPPLYAISYHLSASSGQGDGINGDAILTRSAPGGQEIAMLSDGMGHGAQAHAESQKTLELLSLCMDAGYTVPSALDAINCIMLSSTDGEQYATVDLCVADLWRGTATLDKLGACPSILLSGSSMRVLESSALPLGILPAVRASSHSFAIGDGDLLIQFTDGLSDACGGMHALEQQLSLLQQDRLQRSPEAICTALMSAAMRRSGGAPQDDVTVLCTLFQKRHTKKRDEPACESA